MEARDLPVAAALGALSATVALAFGRVFDSGEYFAPLLAAALVPHVLAWLARVRGWSAAISLGVSALGLTAFAFIFLADISISTLFHRLDAGWRIVQHDLVPVRTTNGTILLAVAIIWIAATVTDELAFRHHASLGALAPGAMVLIWITALGDPDGQWRSVGSFGIAAVLFLALQHQVLLRRRRVALGPTRLVDAPGLVLVALAAGVVAVGVGVTAAPALPGGDTPLFESGGLGRDGKGQTYRTEVPPLLDVGDKLRRGEPQELFTVRAETADYWRITALDEYRSVSGGQWTLTAEGDDDVGEGLDEKVPDDALTQDYRISALGERWMPAAYRPVRVDLDGTLVVRASSTLVTTADSVSGQRYRVESAVPALMVTEAQRDRAGASPPPELLQYTELPKDFPESVRTEAARVTAGMTSAFDKAQALRNYFRDGSFTYDAGVDLGDDEDAIARFLESRRGFCVQFASAYATMARSVGIPTRVAVGFTPGSRDAAGVYVVTNWDAHAWPEVWLAGLGWTHLFDPTPPSGDPGGSQLPNEPAEPPPASTPAPAPAQTEPQPTTPDSAPGTESTQPPPPATVDRAADTSDEGGGVPWIVLVMIGLALLVVAPAGAVLLLKARRRTQRRRSRDPRTAIEGAWHETLDELVERRVQWPESDTPLELARRVPIVAGEQTAEPMRALARAYGSVRYGERTASTEEAGAAWRNVDELREALDTSTRLGARVRARLDPSRLRSRARL